MSTLLEMRIEELEEQNAALAATVEAFTKVISERFTIKETQPDGAVITDGAPWALELLRTTPQHHLRQVRADAGRDGFVAGGLACGAIGHADIAESLADKYHASILAGKE